MAADETWKQRVVRWRHEKDAFFRRDPHSPVPTKERLAFDGLDFHPPDPDWAVTGTARRVEAGDPVGMEMTRGDPCTYLPYAREFITPDDDGITLYYEPRDADSAD